MGFDNQTLYFGYPKPKFCYDQSSISDKEKCCMHRACLVGTFQLIMTVMRDSIKPPHAFNHFWSRSSINLNNSIEYLKFPTFMKEAIKDLPVNFKNQAMLDPTTETNVAMNLEPFIPFCSLYNKWFNDNPLWGTQKIFEDLRFCTLFRPGKE